MISRPPVPPRLLLTFGASRLAAFALALGTRHSFPGPFPFASLPVGGALLTTLLLFVVERRWCTTYVRTIPRGIDEALFPRFSSQEGREIVPFVAMEGARELAIPTPIDRSLYTMYRRKTDLLSTVIADEDPLFLLLSKRLSNGGNRAGIQIGSST